MVSDLVGSTPYPGRWFAGNGMSTAAAMTTKTAPSRKGRMSAEKQLADLKSRLQEIADIGSAASVLSWDQSTYMPPGGAVARGRQMAKLNEIAHKKRIDPAIGRLLDKLEPFAASLPSDSDDACLLSVLRRDYERSVRVPADFVARSSAAASASYNAWVSARPANGFAAMRPHRPLNKR